MSTWSEYKTTPGSGAAGPRTMRRRAIVLAAALALGAGAVTALTGAASAATAADPPAATCSNTTFPVGSGEFLVQRNEYASSAPECVSSTGSPEFTVTASGISNTGGAPGAYTSLYTGCHYGHCSPGGLGHAPIRETGLIPRKVTLSMTSTPLPAGYKGDAAFDTWLSTTRTAPSGAARGTEIMIWLARQGGIQPAGSSHGTVRAAGRTWDLWLSRHADGTGYTVTFLSPVNITSLKGADLNQFTSYVTDHGWAAPAWYLTAVDSGYEIWNGGAGLTDKASVTIANPAPPQGPPAPLTYKLRLISGPGVSRVRACGWSSGARWSCTGWGEKLSTSVSHVTGIGGTWRRGRFDVYWNGGGKGNWSACNTSGAYSGSAGSGTVTLGTGTYPAGPGHSRC